VYTAPSLPHLSDLPAPLTSLVGREREVAEVCGLLRRDDARLVTLTGPGGVGKTRVALAVAAAIGGAFTDGVRFVSLAPITDGRLVVPSVGRAFGIRETTGEPLAERLKAFLRRKRLLLVLDNFEHVAEAAPLVAELLSACPELRVLVTSRVRLRVSGEHERVIPPLGLSAPADRVPDAVRLFVERARAVDAGFARLDAADEVAAVCRLLDGLPLAIELAAARVKLLPPGSLLAHLEHPLRLLTGGGRDQPDRQQTMRDAVSWSYGLLAPAEQLLFRRLSVFVGGFTLDAGAAVVANRGDPCLSILDGVAALLDASLLYRVSGSDGEPRFRMLEVVRHFGLERLEAEGEAEAATLAHAAYFVGLAEVAAEALREPGKAAWLDRLDADFGNLRAAFAAAMDSSDVEVAARQTFALCTFWWHRGHLSEVRGWLERIVAQVERLPPRRRCWILVNAARMALVQGDHDQASQHLAVAVALAREIGDDTSLVEVLSGMVKIALLQGDTDRAESLATEALSAQAALGMPPDGTLPTLLGMVAHRRGQVSRAVGLLREALAQQRAGGNREWIADTLNYLGDAECDLGEYGSALGRYTEALDIWLDLQDGWGIADALVGFSDVAAANGQAALAARLLGAAEARYDASGIRLPPLDRANYPRAMEAAFMGLGPADFDAAREAGRALPDAQVAAEAAAVIPRRPTPARSEPGASRPARGLSEREREVWTLLAAGRSNAEIADALFISLRTATTHVTHLYAKLGVDSRAGAIAAAHQLGRA
jgi:predicted ATPase/DNA-binding CsgD family transcriptional regulator